MNRFIVFFFLSLSFVMTSQDFNVKAKDTIPLKSRVFLGIDTFNAIYTSENRTLYKSDKSGTIEYAALSLGPIASIDLINPLKIVVFYKLTNTVVILDNTLNEITRINFSDLENPKNISLATNAGDRRLWIFNTDLQQLELFDYRQLSVLIEFPPLRMIPQALASDFNFCWVQSKNHLYTYTIYGSLAEEETIDFDFEKLYKSKNLLVGQVKNSLHIKELNIDEIKPLKIDTNAIEAFSLVGRILYIYDGQNLLTFSIEPSK